jgi:hypothetical protein
MPQIQAPLQNESFRTAWLARAQIRHHQPGTLCKKRKEQDPSDELRLTEPLAVEERVHPENKLYHATLFAETALSAMLIKSKLR